MMFRGLNGYDKTDELHEKITAEIKQILIRQQIPNHALASELRIDTTATAGDIACHLLKNTPGDAIDVIYTVQHYLRRLCATLAQGGQGSQQRKALLMQCQTIFASRPESIWTSKLKEVAYDLYAQVHQQAIRQGQWLEKLEAGFELPELQKRIIDEQDQNEAVRWGVLQTDDQGRCKLQQLPADYEIYTPVAELQAQLRFPPTVHQAEDQGAIPVRNGMAFEAIGEGLISITSASQRIELECMSKPSWASGIGRNQQGLWACMPWLGEQLNVPWEVSESIEKGHWVWPSPFGEDEYGVYADLEIKDITQRFRWIEPGTFLMGSSKDELERDNDEDQHPVTLTQGYWLADSTVTQALWQAIMGNNSSQFTNHVNNPVEQVSWNDVQKFINKLNGYIPGLQAYLPTEAQWEYACRAGTKTPFCFGDNVSPEQVNYDGNYPYAGGKQGKYRKQTVPVKSLPANPWGLYEMHGNVWEWCEDVWQENLGVASVIDPGKDQSQSKADALRVIRGGSWNRVGRHCRSTFSNVHHRQLATCLYPPGNGTNSSRRLQPLTTKRSIPSLRLCHTGKPPSLHCSVIST